MLARAASRARLLSVRQPDFFVSHLWSLQTRTPHCTVRLPQTHWSRRVGLGIRSWMGLKAQGVCAGPAVVVVVGGMWGGLGGGLCWPSVKRPAPRGNAPPRWHCWQVTGLFMLAPEKGEQRKGVRRIVQSAGKGRGRAASLCLSYFFASNRLTRPFGYAPLADSATVGAPFGVVGVLSGFMALSGLIFGVVGVSGAIWNKISTSPCGHPCLSHNTPPSAH